MQLIIPDFKLEVFSLRLILFCLVPSGHALIRYSNLGSALYAKEKLNGFEYPPGNRLGVNFVDDGEDRSRYTHTHTRLYRIYLIHKAHKNFRRVTQQKCPLKLIYTYIN